ncbi:hypothetical protein MMC14_003689 [Varicellaria rhodocarpa]|nr:hypothetical protein [Varicellaria rhodocarpa]
MAIDLAIIHWQAQIDSMDMEFVLGSTTTKMVGRVAHVMDTPPQEVCRPNFPNRSIHLWILDFDKATPFEFTKSDVDTRPVPAFLDNDPYYPRPDVDEDLWEEFSNTYLQASMLILGSKRENAPTMELPQRFLDKVVEMIREHED